MHLKYHEATHNMLMSKFIDQKATRVTPMASNQQMV